jgi:hypothetical protein
VVTLGHSWRREDSPLPGAQSPDRRAGREALFGWGGVVVVRAEISTIQVIGSDHVTPWETTETSGLAYWITFIVDGEFASSFIISELNQDPPTGLYGVTTTGFLNSAINCGAGDPLIVFGGVDSDFEVPPPGIVPDLPPGSGLDNQSLELTGHLG